MATIEVDFDVFKELTNRRPTESVSYNDVLRDLLKLNKAPAKTGSVLQEGGVVFDGVHFPEGTQFRKTYKGKLYTAQIRGGAWVDNNNAKCSSPSDAARKVTGNNVNGWRFWECKRPGDATFRLLEGLRPVERLA